MTHSFGVFFLSQVVQTWRVIRHLANSKRPDAFNRFSREKTILFISKVEFYCNRMPKPHGGMTERAYEAKRTYTRQERNTHRTLNRQTLA